MPDDAYRFKQADGAQMPLAQKVSFDPNEALGISGDMRSLRERAEMNAKVPQIPFDTNEALGIRYEKQAFEDRARELVDNPKVAASLQQSMIESTPVGQIYPDSEEVQKKKAALDNMNIALHEEEPELLKGARNANTVSKLGTEVVWKGIPKVDILDPYRESAKNVSRQSTFANYGLDILEANQYGKNVYNSLKKAKDENPDDPYLKGFNENDFRAIANDAQVNYAIYKAGIRGIQLGISTAAPYGGAVVGIGGYMAYKGSGGERDRKENIFKNSIYDYVKNKEERDYYKEWKAGN